MSEENINKTEEVKNKYISIDDFAKVEIMLGTVMSAEEVEGSDKLYRLKVDFGEVEKATEAETFINGVDISIEKPKYRNVFSGIKKYVSVDEIVGKQFPFVTNLEPRKMMGDYSEAMILAGSEGETLALMSPTKVLPNGTKLR